nr:hypothetical protein [Parachlamydiaceae bacterium]
LKAEKREDDWISIVAYKSIDPFFNDAFCFEKSPNIKFGSVSDLTINSLNMKPVFSKFIWEIDVPYCMFKTSLESVTQHKYSLYKKELEGKSLQMRDATPEEVNNLQNAVSIKKAFHLYETDLVWEKFRGVARRQMVDRAIKILLTWNDKDSCFGSLPKEVVFMIILIHEKVFSQ